MNTAQATKVCELLRIILAEIRLRIPERNLPSYEKPVFLVRPKEEYVARASACIVEGLTTDGAHHKQWALEKALGFLTPDMATLKAEYGWEDGIEP